MKGEEFEQKDAKHAKGRKDKEVSRNGAASAKGRTRKKTRAKAQRRKGEEKRFVHGSRRRSHGQNDGRCKAE
jgi:hypothetical protein